MAEIVFKDVKMSYYGKAALSIDLLAFDGRLAVLGGAGAGKSNLIKAAAGTEFISGEIFIGEKEVGGDKPKHRSISLISFSTPLFLRRSVEYNLSYPLKIRGVKKCEILAAVTAAAGEYSLDLAKKAGELNFKEQAALFAARALIKKPDLLLLDEPHDVIFDIDYFKSLLKEKYSGSVIYASHDYLESEDFCEKFVILKRGEIIFNGTKSELLSSKDPYITHFIR